MWPTLRKVWSSPRVPERHTVVHCMEFQYFPPLLPNSTQSPALRKVRRPRGRVAQGHVVAHIAMEIRSPLRIPSPSVRNIRGHPFALYVATLSPTLLKVGSTPRLPQSNVVFHVVNRNSEEHFPALDTSTWPGKIKVGTLNFLFERGRYIRTFVRL